MQNRNDPRCTPRAVSDDRPARRSPTSSVNYSRSLAHRLNDIRRRLNTAIRDDHQDAAGPWLLRSILDCLPAVGVLHFQGNESGSLKLVRRLNRNSLSITDGMIQALREAAVVACEQDQIKAVPFADPTTPTAFVVPSAAVYGNCDCVGIIVDQPRPTDEQVAMLNMLGAYVAAGRLIRESARSENDAAQATAIAELIGQLPSRNKLADACSRLANALQRHFRCQRVVIGLVERRQGNCRMRALSQVDDFSNSSDMCQTLDLALQEAILNGETILWKTSSSQRLAPGQRRTLEMFSAQTLVAGVLSNSSGEAVGAWLFLGDATFADDPLTVRAIDTASEPIGNVMQLLQEAEPWRIIHRAAHLWKERKRWQSRTLCGAVALLIAILLFPFPYHVKCDFTLRPVQRRFLAAPFEGVLQRSHCKPGEVVQAGQLLAELDGRELRMELAALTAEKEHAAKQRQVALAGRDAAAAQQAQLQMERIDLRIRLLEGRKSNLELRSPIGGMILRGDLENAIGVPVSIGQTLFEIAPLTELVAELSIPDEEVHYITAAGRVTLVADAVPKEPRTAPLSRVHPVAELRDSQNVFVGESVVSNVNGSLRPGMRGRAKVAAGRRSLAWILFHRPWNAIARWWNV